MKKQVFTCPEEGLVKINDVEIEGVEAFKVTITPRKIVVDLTFAVDEIDVRFSPYGRIKE